MTIDKITENAIEGNGHFDRLMKATTVHLDAQWDKNRLRGPEYAKVYLSGLQTAMQQAIAYTSTEVQNRLTEEQILMVGQQRATEVVNTQIAQRTLDKMGVEINELNARITVLNKEASLLDSRIIGQNNTNTQILRQTSQIEAETLNVPKQGQLLDAQRTKTANESTQVLRRTEQIQAETLNVPKQGLLIDAQRTKTANESTQVLRQTEKIQAETLNVPKQGVVLDRTANKLLEEVNLINAQVTKTGSETNLLNQKVLTERAQVDGTIPDANSVIGRQNEVLRLQASGYTRLAEQKAAAIVADIVQMQLGVAPESTPVGSIIPDSTMTSIFSALANGV